MAEPTNFIIKYLADIKDIQNSVRAIGKLNKTIANNLGKDFTKATEIISRNIDKVSSKRIELKGGKSVLQTTSQISTVFKDTNGNVQTLRESFKQTGNSVTRLSTTVSKGGKTTRTFADNIKTLAQRALLTIPIWFALRTAISGVFRTIRDGFTSFIEFDRILQKARRSLQGTSEEIERDFKRLREATIQLSIDTGESVNDIASAFQRFSTLGFDFETSIAGATEATKLAVALFGDAEQNANALARAFKLLQDTSEGAIPPSEQLALITAQLADLWKDNAFEINEFAGALERFAPVANIANFSAAQTVSVLASLQTAGIRGTRAGRLLATSILQLDKNFSKISKTLGLEINPQLTSTFDRFLLVLDAIEELNKVDTLGASQAIQELFGGVRGAQTVQALLALREVLDDNLRRTGDINEFNQAVQDVTDTASRQVDIFKRLTEEIGRSFVFGVLGADRFTGSAKEVNETLEQIAKRSQDFGRAFNVAIRTTFQGTDAIIDDFTDIFRDRLEKAEQDATNIFKRIVSGIRGELSKAEIGDLLVEIREGQIEIPEGRERIEEALEIQLLKEPIEVETDVTVKAREVAFQAQQDISKLILKNQLEQLRSQGALTSEILRAEQALIKQFDIKEDILDIISRELQIEREIREERRLQNSLSSDSIKLFRIAQEEGVDVARRIGEVLAGDVDFGTFIRRGGEAVEIFKKRFDAIFEQQQAQRFFAGETVPDLRDLRGGGRIPIREEQLRRTISPFSARAEIQRQRAIRQVQQLQNIQVDSTLNVNISGLATSEVGDKIKTDIVNELNNPESPFSKALTNRLEEF